MLAPRCASASSAPPMGAMGAKAICFPITSEVEPPTTLKSNGFDMRVGF